MKVGWMKVGWMDGWVTLRRETRSMGKNDDVEEKWGGGVEETRYSTTT